MRGYQQFYTDDEEEFVALPADVLEQIDEQLGNRYKNRTDFIRAATLSYISTKKKTPSQSPKHLVHVL